MALLALGLQLVFKFSVEKESHGQEMSMAKVCSLLYRCSSKGKDKDVSIKELDLASVMVGLPGIKRASGLEDVTWHYVQ